jgi:DinB family protein
MPLQETLRRLDETLRLYYPRLAAIGEDASLERPAGMKWSRKEILGHLVDSASNNHQRFVRSQLATETAFPPYDQESWISVQGYGERPWGEIVLLWRSYNLHLLHVMSRVPSGKLGHLCVVQEDEPTTLGDHMTDYVEHLVHHLDQILQKS